MRQLSPPHKLHPDIFLAAAVPDIFDIKMTVRFCSDKATKVLVLNYLG